MKAFVISFCLFALAGCSVETGIVRNQPPVIGDTVTTSLEKAEFGWMEFNHPMDMDGISMFFWPLGLSEPQVVEKVRTVNTASMTIDSEFAALDKAVNELGAKFVVANCVNLSTIPDVSIRDEIQWKALEPTDSSFETLETCKSLKDQYSSTTAEGFTKIATLKEQILAEVGPENWMEINKKTSSLSILPRGSSGVVSLTLKIGKITYSTSLEKVGGKEAQVIRAATYLPSRRLLSFEMNELGADRKPTGSIYKFSMERIEVNSLPRYTGDVRLYSEAGELLRNGSAQITGEMRIPTQEEASTLPPAESVVATKE